MVPLEVYWHGTAAGGGNVEESGGTTLEVHQTGGLMVQNGASTEATC